MKSTNKQILALEIPLGITSVAVFLVLILFAALNPMADWQRVVLIVIASVQFLITACCMLRLEQLVGFYHCSKCGHFYVPTYNSLLWAFHFGRTRYLKCPKCHQKSWQKKKLTKGTAK